MKIIEKKNKIIIAELDDDKDYIVLVDPSNVRMETLEVALGKNKKTRNMPVVIAYNLDRKVVQFIEIPTTNKV